MSARGVLEVDVCGRAVEHVATDPSLFSNIDDGFGEFFHPSSPASSSLTPSSSSYASFRLILVHKALGRDPAQFWHLPGASLLVGHSDSEALVAQPM